MHAVRSTQQHINTRFGDPGLTRNHTLPCSKAWNKNKNASGAFAFWHAPLWYNFRRRTANRRFKATRGLTARLDVAIVVVAVAIVAAARKRGAELALNLKHAIVDADERRRHDRGERQHGNECGLELLGRALREQEGNGKGRGEENTGEGPKSLKRTHTLAENKQGKKKR
jgi:hypothetical protein